MNPIQEIRKALGLSQAAFARTLDVTQSTVSQYERNVIRPDFARAVKLIELAKKHKLRTSLEDLYRPELQEVNHA